MRNWRHTVVLGLLVASLAVAAPASLATPTDGAPAAGPTEREIVLRAIRVAGGRAAMG